MLTLGEGYAKALLLSDAETIVIRKFEKENDFSLESIQVILGLLERSNRTDTCQKLLVWVNNCMDDADFIQKFGDFIKLDVFLAFLSNSDESIHLLSIVGYISASPNIANIDITPLLEWRY